ncbi:hypothetical protein [Nannocystis pusilla]|uniref:hypothetical protein n=1 Tax=Nannocystis pusilla TaxID=889268 RepID=UPI003B788AD1
MKAHGLPLGHVPESIVNTRAASSAGPSEAPKARTNTAGSGASAATGVGDLKVTRPGRL